MNARVAGVELGGTKCTAALAHGEEVLERVHLPTRDPEATLGELAAAVRGWAAAAPLAAVGIASFGPIVVARDDPRFGRMLDTPKPGWSGADVAGAFAGLAGRVALHTDVTAAALAEARRGAAEGARDLLYVTLGTGIGMGVIAGGRAVTGRLHPEAGHLRPRRLPGDSFAGICPFHGDCLEGLASGPAVAARAGRPAEELGERDPAWEPVVAALAEAFHTLWLALALERLVVGGGLGLGAPHLLPRIAAAMARLNGGYLPEPPGGFAGGLLVPAALGADAGLIGALLLAQDPELA